MLPLTSSAANHRVAILDCYPTSEKNPVVERTTSNQTSHTARWSSYVRGVCKSFLGIGVGIVSMLLLVSGAHAELSLENHESTPGLIRAGGTLQGAPSGRYKLQLARVYPNGVDAFVIDEIDLINYFPASSPITYFGTQLPSPSKPFLVRDPLLGSDLAGNFKIILTEADTGRFLESSPTVAIQGARAKVELTSPSQGTLFISVEDAVGGGDNGAGYGVEILKLPTRERVTLLYFTDSTPGSDFDLASFQYNFPTGDYQVVLYPYSTTTGLTGNIELGRSNSVHVVSPTASLSVTGGAKTATVEVNSASTHYQNWVALVPSSCGTDYYCYDAYEYVPGYGEKTVVFNNVTPGMYTARLYDGGSGYNVLLTSQAFEVKPAGASFVDVSGSVGAVQAAMKIEGITYAFVALYKSSDPQNMVNYGVAYQNPGSIQFTGLAAGSYFMRSFENQQDVSTPSKALAASSPVVVTAVQSPATPTPIPPTVIPTTRPTTVSTAVPTSVPSTPTIAIPPAPTVSIPPIATLIPGSGNPPPAATTISIPIATSTPVNEKIEPGVAQCTQRIIGQTISVLGPLLTEMTIQVRHEAGRLSVVTVKDHKQATKLKRDIKRINNRAILALRKGQELYLSLGNIRNDGQCNLQSLPSYCRKVINTNTKAAIVKLYQELVADFIRIKNRRITFLHKKKTKTDRREIQEMRGFGRSGEELLKDVPEENIAC